MGSGALPGKTLLVRNIENNKIDDYFRSEKVGLASQGWESYQDMAPQD